MMLNHSELNTDSLTTNALLKLISGGVFIQMTMEMVFVMMIVLQKNAMFVNFIRNMIIDFEIQNIIGEIRILTSVLLSLLHVTMQMHCGRAC